MAPGSKKGKEFMQDKDKLLQLAETISSGKELDARHKIDKTKAAGSSRGGSQKTDSQRRKTSAGSDKLRAAMEIVAARQTRHKREKVKARRRQVHASKSDAMVGRGSGTGNSAGGAPNRKRVSFA